MTMTAEPPTAPGAIGPVPRRSWGGLVLLVAAPLWAVVPLAGVPALLAAYLLALVVVNVSLARFDLAAAWGGLRRGQRWLLGLLLAAPAAPTLFREAATHQWDRRLAGFAEHTADRWALERKPALAPPLVVSDQPQRFFLHAPGAAEASVRWTPEGPVWPTVSLGQGVFLLDFNPRHDESLRQARGPLQAEWIVDGTRHERSLPLYHPQPHPRWFSAAPAQGLAATVSEETDELIVVQRDGRHRRWPVGDGPSDCAVFASGTRAAVAHRYLAELWVIDLATGETLLRRPLPGPGVRLAVSPDGGWLAAACDGRRSGVQFFSLPDAKPAEFLPWPTVPDLLTYGRDAAELVWSDRRARGVYRFRRTESSAAAVEARWREEGEPLFLPRPVTALCRVPQGGEVWLATNAAPLGPAATGGNHYVEHVLHRVDLASWKLRDTRSTERRSPQQWISGGVAHGLSPLGLAALGDEMLVAFAGSDEVQILPVGDGLPRAFTFESFPLAAPYGVADLGEGVWCVSSPSQGTIGVIRSPLEPPEIIALAPTDEELAAADPAALERRRGEQTFHAGTTAGVSCLSCHHHADSDDCLHDIGQGMLSNVLSVRGVAGTSPYLRDASHPQLADLHDVSAEIYRGFLRPVEWDRRAAVAAWLASLPLVAHPRTLEPLDADRMRRGLAAFAKAECIHCHAPPAMTNLGQHPERLLFPEEAQQRSAALGRHDLLDTPSLRGASLYPPYLHDGRAATLDEVLREFNRAGRHGAVRALDDGEYADLRYFLEQL